MSNIKTYSLKKDGNTKLTANFRVREFACNDGSDTVKIDTKNVYNLQRIRNYFNKSIKITSGYRTPAYNKKIGGATNSYHTKGMATDIVVSGIDPVKVAMYAESIGVKGVIYYPKQKFVHIDNRSNAYHAINNGKTYNYVEPTITLKKGSKGVYVKWLQFMLKEEFNFSLTIDGDYGASTEKAVISFQKKYNLTADGIFGVKSKEKLKQELMK